jgi:hypothetical protein
MDKQIPMTPEQSFFAVCCIEALANELHISGNEIYTLLTEKSDILDAYIIPNYEVLHTQGLPWLVAEITRLMKKKGIIK